MPSQTKPYEKSFHRLFALTGACVALHFYTETSDRNDDQEHGGLGQKLVPVFVVNAQPLSDEEHSLQSLFEYTQSNTVAANISPEGTELKMEDLQNDLRF